ncbi:MAG: hypothetical protein WD766_06010 [Gemmatimonadota bacterium]
MDGNERQEKQTNETGRIERATERAKEVLDRTRDGMAAGASGLAEASRDVAGKAGTRIDRVATVVRESEPDEHVRETVSGTTEKTVHRAGATLNRAAPAIGRNAERIADRTGDALHFAAGPLARILGAIAATVGGWWKRASKENFQLPPEEEEACRAHFATLMIIPSELSYEKARAGYALGYGAGSNPDYRGRPFDDIEGDLRSGFGADGAGEYERLRDFARFGYGRTAL